MTNINLRINKFIIVSIFLILFAYLTFNLGDYFRFDNNGISFSRQFSDFVTYFRSIIIQALPFIVLGVLISTLVNLFLDQKFILKYLPKNKILSNICLSFLGFLMPVCECGNIPVARSMVMKGFSVSQAFTFLLAAPIINPVTILTTFVAFQDSTIVGIRVLAAFVIANFIGFIINLKKDQNEFLTKEFYDEVCEIHDHTHNENKLKQGLEIFSKEFFIVLQALVIGAIIAAASQSFIPREIIIAIGSNPILSILAMILLSFVISICSSVDAFFAMSYQSSFTLGSLLSFLVFGPMVDIKILTLMSTSFKPKLLVIVVSFVTLFSILVGLLINYLL
jgi:hypothetical protein